MRIMTCKILELTTKNAEEITTIVKSIVDRSGFSIVVSKSIRLPTLS